MSWPPGKREVSGCELESFKYKKLCVPADGQPGNFRVKIKVKTSCGDMIM